MNSDDVFDWLDGFDDEQAENSDLGGDSDGEDQMEVSQRQTIVTRNSLVTPGEYIKMISLFFENISYRFSTKFTLTISLF